MVRSHWLNAAKSAESGLESLRTLVVLVDGLSGCAFGVELMGVPFSSPSILTLASRSFFVTGPYGSYVVRLT